MMIRSLLSAMLVLSLSGCWVSEGELFDSGDWAHLDLDGTYISEDGNGQERGQVVLTARPDGLIDGVATDNKGGEPETSTVGMVRIPGGSGEFYVMVDGDEGRTGGQIYLLGHVTSSGGIEVYWPQCAGTPDTAEMTRETPSLGLPGESLPDPSLQVCTFASKAALLRAALEAERFLSTPHIVEIAPMGRLKPKEETDSVEWPDEDGGN